MFYGGFDRSHNSSITIYFMTNALFEPAITLIFILFFPFAD